MPPGPKPKPTETKRRENVSKRPLPAVVKVAGAHADLEPPADLPPDGLALWSEVVTALRDVGIVDGVDRPALTLLCVQWARAEQARRVLASEGLFALGSMGQITEHPALAIERAAAALWIRFAEQYALTAAGRARLGLAALQARSLAEELREALGESSERSPST
jgi:P27 family predicted phage terminase small subunit